MSTLIILLILIILLYIYLTKDHNYWLKKGVPYKRPHLFFGNLMNVFFKRESYVMAVNRLYKDGEGYRYFGVFSLLKPSLMIRDVKLISNIFKTDFSTFSSRGLVSDHKRDPLSTNVFFMDGHLWKRSRELLRPGFKSGRLRCLVPEIEKAAKVVFGNGRIKSSFEMKTLSKRFAAAVILGPVLGIELDEEMLNIFLHHCGQSFNLHGWRIIPVLLRLFLPRIALAIGMKAVPPETEKFFIDIVENLKLGRNDGEIRQDYIQTILSSVNGLSEKYSDKEFLKAVMCGQFFIFVLGGFETTTSVVTHAVYLLAQHQEVCNIAREEILNVMNGSRENFTYDHLKEMKYLENVINEVLRLYPPIAGYVRVCTSKYKIPDSNVVLQPGDTVQIPVYCIQHDPKYFENPEEFQPSRFDGPIIEGTFLPFADGPRTCLGMRLAIMELKICLAYILLHYKITPEQRTPKEIDFDREHLTCIPASDIWINFEPL